MKGLCSLRGISIKNNHYYYYIYVGNNAESQLAGLIGRKERKWIWDLRFITPYGLYQDDGFHCQNKGVESFTSSTGLYDYLFSYFLLLS